MERFVEHVDVWAATIPDRPGGLAGVLATLHEVGAELQFIIARRAPDQPGQGVDNSAPPEGTSPAKNEAMITARAARTFMTCSFDSLPRFP